MRFLTKTELRVLDENGYQVLPWCVAVGYKPEMGPKFLEHMDKEKYMMPDGQVICLGPDSTIFSLEYLQNKGILKDTVDFGGAVRCIRNGGKVRRGDKLMFVRDNKLVVEITKFAAALSNEDYMADDWEVTE